MKYLSILTFTLLSIGVFAQSEPLNATKKTAFGLYFSPTLNYRTLTSNAPNDLVKEFRNSEEIAALGFRTGITIEHRVFNNLDFQYGLIFSNRIFRTKKQDLVWSDENINHVTEAFMSQQYYYFDIPLKLKYNLSSQNQINLFVSSGINIASLFGQYQRNHVKISGDWEVARDELPLASFVMLLAEVEFGFEYEFHPNFKFSASSYFQHAFTATNPNFNTKEFLYSGGLSLGLIFMP